MSGMVAHNFNSRIWDTKAGGSVILGQPSLRSKLQTSQSYIVRPFLKQNSNSNNLLHVGAGCCTSHNVHVQNLRTSWCSGFSYSGT